VDFPVLVLLDEQACYAFLVDALHPQLLRCPGCCGSHHATHRSRRDPVLDFRCAACGRVFKDWTGALLQGTQRTPAQLVPVLRGLAQSTSTARLVSEGHPGKLCDQVPDAVLDECLRRDPLARVACEC
jgi:hypothetical protein